MRCCGEKLEPMLPNTVDAAHEKHLPVVTRTEKGLHVKVGSTDHPMQEAHHIVWIELVAGNTVIRKYLKPGDNPEADFPMCENCCCGCEKLLVREYCNIHGLWQIEIK
jgi:superoxide reductase